MPGDPINITLGRRFDHIADTYPENPAVMDDGGFISYRELQRQVNALCSALLTAGIAANSRVGLLCDRGPDWVAAMVAIVKIGAVYVPLSWEDPLPHIERLVADVQVALVLTDRDDRLSFVPTMKIKEMHTTPGVQGKDYPRVADDELAYIMFTSGTTGTPKGVGVTHNNILNLTVDSGYVTLDAGTRILQTGAPTFDASTFEVWGALLNGGGLFIPSQRGLTDFEYIGQAVQQYGITTMWLTAPLFHIAAEQNPCMFAGIRELIVGGDVVNPVSVNKVLDACPEISLFNGYGPTECTTFSAVYPITYRANNDAIPIGKPIKNVFVHVLDEALKPVKPGEIGELYIGGKGVSSGYVNRPELNQEAFIDNPFGPGTLYRSGDRVSEGADGTLHYWGRKDRQVKIRGYRIELSAVESMLEALGEIEAAAVCAVSNQVGGKELGSCVAVRGGAAISPDEIRQKFSEVAPSHMQLSTIVITAALPLNKHGKIDYGSVASALERAYAVHDETAQDTAKTSAWSAESAAWSDEALLSELIGKRVGVAVPDAATSFFDLGMDSLTAVYVARDIGSAFGTKLGAVDVLAYPNVSDLIGFIRSLPTSQSVPGQTPSAAKKLPLLHQQKSFFVDYQLNPDSVRYHVPVLFRLSRDVSISRLMDALHQVVARHEALRVQFAMSGQEIFQTIVENPTFTINRLAGSPSLKGLIRPFSLASGLPFRFAIGEDTEGAWLFMDYHHIAVDGASLLVIVQDLNLAYEGHPLPELRDNLATVVEKANAVFQQNRDASIAYWRTYLQDYSGMHELPVDKQGDADVTLQSHTFSFQINEERTSALRSWSQKNNMTLFESLLLAYACFLHAITSSSEVMFATPSRDYSAGSHEPVVAMLTNTLWVYSKANRDESIADFITAFTRHLRESRKYQDIPLDQMVKWLKPNNSAARSTFTDTLIAYHRVQDMSAVLLGKSVSLRPINPGEGMFSLNLQIFDCAAHLELEWEYMTDLFESETISSLCEMFRFMLDLLTGASTSNAQNVPDLVAACIQMQMA